MKNEDNVTGEYFHELKPKLNNTVTSRVAFHVIVTLKRTKTNHGVNKIVT